MQNDVKRKNMYFVENICEIYSFRPVLSVLDYSGSFDCTNRKIIYK